VRLMPRTRGGALWRFALAVVLIVSFTAATTAVAGLLQVKEITNYLSQTPAFKDVPIKLPNPGDPQTILVIGSDHRAGTSYISANTDTMMLIRLDASSSTINLLSIPRDLRVQLPDGTAKLNAAYSEGGPRLLINTLKRQVFPGLVVNHILDVNFGGFEDLVDAIGCVYTDVDHRYYNNTAQTDYSSIDVRPGYQKLCGPQALQFVRFRHTDSDIVRNARQQDFIRWAKDQYSVSQIFNNRDKLLKIFGAHVQTDHSLHTTDGLINLFDLVLGAAGHEIKQIPFPAQFLPCGGGTGQTPCYVVPTSSGDELAAFRQFMTPTQPSAAAATGGSGSNHHHKHTKLSTAGLMADPNDGQEQAKDLGGVAMPIYYPKLIAAGANYCYSSTGNCDEYPNPDSEYIGAYPRGYQLHGRGGGIYPAYRMTLVINSALGEYYGIQGTTWQHPPILNNVTETRTVNGKVLDLFYNGAHVSLVAWRTPTGVYWISNSLIDSIGNGEMLAMAASLTRAR
jgi:polyisoprenyl-teichoic acid--peptidoglycan teichoic acid transferase